MRRSEDGSRSVEIACDKQSVRVEGIRTPFRTEDEPSQAGGVELRGFIDKSVMEAFINRRYCITKVIYRPEEDVGVERTGDGQAAGHTGVEANPVSPKVATSQD